MKRIPVSDGSLDATVFAVGSAGGSMVESGVNVMASLLHDESFFES
jgi:hypothetical protein